MTQLSLGYSPEHQGRQVWQLELDWCRRAVDAIGHKEVAYALDVKPSTLTDALCERKREDATPKGMRAEWVSVIRQMSSDGMRAEYLRLISTPLGYVPQRVRVMDPIEELRATREAIARLAPGLLSAVDREVGR